MNTQAEHFIHHSAAEDHRAAAHHFEAAAKHRRLAADADDRDDSITAAHHAYLAYGHQVRGIAHAAQASVQDQVVDHDDVDHGDDGKY